ncbi:MAG: LysR family transcriptional regulator [Ahrensia sp.]|nr:LysR family transcriptional regulator [Ahrensia sp.]|tara:strand:- start:5687 stop:6520 length:834 start_codon:yes stop_codon:yes gene_type:complete
MDWDDLKVAAALARSGTYAGAAAETGLDATTVARRIARLEASFPFALFHAVDGRRQPTARGAEVIGHVEAMSAHAIAIGAIPADGKGVSGHVRIAATASICDRVLAPHAAAFLDMHPGLTLSLLASDANVSFTRYEADIAIRMARPRRGGFTIRRLASLPLVLCKPAQQGDAIVCAYPDSLADTPEMAELARLGFKEKARFLSNSPASIRAVLASGRAAAVLPVLGGEPTATDRLQLVPLDRRRDAWLLTQPHLKKDPAARAVADWIEKSFSRLKTD